MTESEKYLFERLKKGDEAAFKVIYNMYVPRLYYFAYEYVPYRDLVENIVQETLMVLWGKKNELADNTNLGAYLFTVAKNNCLYKLRDRRYKQQLFDSNEMGELELKFNLDALSSLDTSQFAFFEIEKIIADTLEQLPPQCREVFRLSRFEEKKNREIAAELGISEKTVEGHLTKALKLFRATLKDYLPIVAFLFVP
ncbi:RNA polymerase sigma-70 factor [Gaoshiqia sp. Z1-71]|uniref:RNA polymerase sigma-70 factor n=1 Tax=Gaoshiqia hydrogeniformans TaxID=3290090 RepID=UPI003BF7E8AB